MEENRTMARFHARLNGRVQGVGFRYFVQRVATDLEVTGWVRNRWDSSVEVVAEGSRPQLERLVQALHRGPRGSRVDQVAVEWEDPTGDHARFLIRQTG